MHCITGTQVSDGRPLPPPAALLDELPLPGSSALAVGRARAQVRAVLDGTDDRLLVVTGPCSIHDPRAALDYARRLAAIGLSRDLLVVMRVFVEKPRTVKGWTGLISDPDMNGSHDVPRGLRAARQLLLDITAAGVPAACEWLHPLTALYLGDIVAWAAVGARTTESQPHRQLASGLAMPTGFKNTTDGDIRAAIDACLAASSAHTFLGTASDGLPAVVTTKGNRHCHVVLRGGRSGPNYTPTYVAKALDMIADAGLPRRVMVDASHGNSGKDHCRQPHVAAVIARQVAAGECGLSGVMLESFLVGGRQEPGALRRLVYGQSVTDACMDWDTTVTVLQALAAAVRQRRHAAAGSEAPDG
jgi:3-deoxy-7-phosphoheptulonate synthase